MIEFIAQLARETWHIFTDAAPYVVFGFVAAGMIKALMPEEMVTRHLGGRSFTAVIKASLFGIPLPLCSCGVIPAAIGLRKQGAGRGPSAAFLVSTPESGVDSIAITWALLDPVMTVVARFSGRKATFVYLAVISSCSLVLGFLVSKIILWFAIDINNWVTSSEAHDVSIWGHLVAIVLLLLIARAYWVSRKSDDCCGTSQA